MIKIIDSVFNPYQEVENYQNQLNQIFGATCVFVGTMRDFNEGYDIQSMTLEHYAGMTEKQLEKIINDVKKQWSILDYLIIHRIGEIQPHEAIVLIGIWSIHRGDAFDSACYVMEMLKKNAPFWKKEHLKNNTSRWVEKNTDGYLK